MIKISTSLEQSKKLVELGLDTNTANMCYKCLGEDPYDLIVRPYSDWKEEYKGLLIRGDANVIPCWSLAALLSVLPYPSLYKTSRGWRCASYNKEGTSCIIGESSDNPVDACYELVLKLHELKML